MKTFKKIILGLLGGIVLENLVMIIIENIFKYNMDGLLNEGWIEYALYMLIIVIPFIIGFVIAYKYSNKELEALDYYDCNFALAAIRIFFAIVWMARIFTTNILVLLINLVATVSLLPITYRLLDSKLNIKVPKWLQTVIAVVAIVCSVMI